MDDITGRMARLEAHAEHTPTAKDMLDIEKRAAEYADRSGVKLLSDMEQKNSWMRAGLLSDIKIELNKRDADLLVKFQDMLDQKETAQQRAWARIGMVAGGIASLLPSLIILFLWLSGYMSGTEAVQTAIETM